MNADLQPDPARCGAKNRQGQPCRRRPAKGSSSGRCKLHGGASLSGILSPTWKTGRHSRSLPAKLAARYDQSLSDRELLALQSEVAILDARVFQLSERMKSDAASDGLWLRLRAAWKDFRTAAESKNAAAAEQTLRDIGAVINAGAADAELWDELNSALARKAAMCDRENRRLRELDAFVRVEDVLALVVTLGGIVRQHVKDTALVNVIARDVESLMCRDQGLRPMFGVAGRDQQAVGDSIDGIVAEPTPVAVVSDSVALQGPQLVENKNDT